MIFNNIVLSVRVNMHRFKLVSIMPLSGVMDEFANGPGDQSSIPGWVISKTQKMVLDVSLIISLH